MQNKRRTYKTVDKKVSKYIETAWKTNEAQRWTLSKPCEWINATYSTNSGYNETPTTIHNKNYVENMSVWTFLRLDGELHIKVTCNPHQYQKRTAHDFILEIKYSKKIWNRRKTNHRPNLMRIWVAQQIKIHMLSTGDSHRGGS